MICIMARMEATVRFLLTLHLTHSVLVWGAKFNDTKKAPTILVRPPDLDQFDETRILNSTKRLAALHLPRSSSATCHVAIGGHRFYTVGGDETMSEAPAPFPSPAQRPHLQEAPPTSYNWPAMGAVEVWNTKDLVRALLVGNPYIIVAKDLDVSDAVPLPDIIFQVTIMGVCSGGSYCSLDAKGMSNIFLIAPGGYLTLKDLELRNGHCAEGGAVQVIGTGTTKYGEGGKFAALDVDFYNNSATEMGGAIYLPGAGAAYCDGCIFYGNSAPMGGAVYIGGAEPLPVVSAGLSTATRGIASRNDSRVTSLDDALPGAVPGCGLSSCSSMVDSLFLLNWANEGGAVYIEDATQVCAPYKTGGGTIDIRSSLFENNTAISGGGMYMQYRGSGTIAQIQDTYFTGNVATEFGGDITLASDGNINGSFLFAYRTEFSGTIEPMPDHDGVFVKYPQEAYFSDCTFAGSHTVNCSGFCHYCPRGAKMHATMPAVHPEVLGRLKVHYPWPKTQGTGGCPRSLGESVCGWVPVECAPSHPLPTAPPPAAPPMPQRESGRD